MAVAVAIALWRRRRLPS